MLDKDKNVLEVDVRELAGVLPTLLKVRVSTAAACAAEVGAVLGAMARTVVFAENTVEATAGPKGVVLSTELERELLGQL